MASDPLQRKWTIEEYLALEESTQSRYEYVNGEVFAMTGGTDNHSTIKVNCVTTLNIKRRTSGKSCRIFDSDMKVKVDEDNQVYPDFSVVCGERKFDDKKRTQLTNPILVGEVTSDSSAKYDKSLKADIYRMLDSLRYYVVIDQNKVHVQVWSLQDNGWLLQDFKSRDDVIMFDALNISLQVADMYDDIDFDES